MSSALVRALLHYFLDELITEEYTKSIQSDLDRLKHYGESFITLIPPNGNYLTLAYRHVHRDLP